MFDKLEDLLIRFEEIMGELHEPTVTNNQERFRKLMKEQSDLTPIVDAYTEYKKCKQDIEDSLSMLEEEKDEEMREMIKETLNDSKKRVEELEQELKILLLPKDPNDDKNVIVEIRAGAGGDEAALFAGSVTNISAFNLGSILGGVVKVGGIGFLVDKYGESINSAINSVMMKEGAGTNYATKVVPIVSIGNSGYIGAAQVIGDADQVAKVEAVGQLEISWNDKLFRIKGLIPMDSKNPTSFSRVQGVGVSAVIDVRV